MSNARKKIVSENNNNDGSRRDFLRRIGYLGVATAAVNFGFNIEQAFSANTNNIAILYATKYGATKDTAQWVSEGFKHNIEVLNVKEVRLADLHRYDGFILGSAVIKENILSDMQSAIKSFSSVFKDKVLATFIVCGTEGKNEREKKHITGYINRFNALLPTPPKQSQYFGGRMIVSKLTEEDRLAMTRFYQKILKRKLTNWDRTNSKLAITYGELINTTVF